MVTSGLNLVVVIFTFLLVFAAAVVRGNTAELPPATVALQPCVDLGAPAPIRALYVSAADDIINSPPSPFVIGAVNGNKLLQWSYSNNYNRLILYGITGELADHPTSFPPKLGSFIRKAHEFYGISISINVASYNSASNIMVDNYLALPLITFDPLMRFDALHYEAEYWNSGSGIVFDDGSGTDYASQLSQICNLAGTHEFECETYIGNPTKDGTASDSWSPNLSLPLNQEGQDEIDYINGLVDRIYVAYYKDSPFSPGGNHFQSKKYRFGYLQGSASPTDVVVLFNVRNDDTPDPNLYAWLSSNGGVSWPARWPRPYNIWMNCADGYNDHSPTTNVNVHGYAYYRFQNMYKMSRKYLKAVSVAVAHSFPTSDVVKITITIQQRCLTWSRLDVISPIDDSVHYSAVNDDVDDHNQPCLAMDNVNQKNTKEQNTATKKITWLIALRNCLAGCRGGGNRKCLRRCKGGKKKCGVECNNVKFKCQGRCMRKNRCTNKCFAVPKKCTSTKCKKNGRRKQIIRRFECENNRCYTKRKMKKVDGCIRRCASNNNPYKPTNKPTAATPVPSVVRFSVQQWRPGSYLVVVYANDGNSNNNNSNRDSIILAAEPLVVGPPPPR